MSENGKFDMNTHDEPGAEEFFQFLETTAEEVDCHYVANWHERERIDREHDMCLCWVIYYPGMTARELAAFSGMDIGTFERHLPQLERENMVKRHRNAFNGTFVMRRCRIAGEMSWIWYATAMAAMTAQEVA